MFKNTRLAKLIRKLRLNAWPVLLLLIPITLNAADDREATICGFFKERFHFYLWNSITPKPDNSQLLGLPNIEEISYTTSDNKRLVGYRYRAHTSYDIPVAAKGYILVALGNAMIADQIIRHIKPFAAKGYDIYIYDYRGYGNSEGLRRINAIIEDYKEITQHLNSRYERKLLYGISLGGIVISNVIGAGVKFDAAVIDSSPSRLSDYGCPTRIDPINNLPRDARKLLIITGERDQVVNKTMTQALRIEAKKRGAIVYVGNDFAHPFMDRRHDTHLRRMNIIKQFLTEQQSPVGDYP